MIDKLENIGFYTLSDKRALTATHKTPIERAEFILTDACNFNCVYCQGIRKDYRKTLSRNDMESMLAELFKHNLVNVRFSGGEPTIHPDLPHFVKLCKDNNVKHIAISTNGSASLEYYKNLIALGVNDFSISLDSGCCAIADKMAGVSNNSAEIVINNIRELSKLTYVTVGMVFNEENISNAIDDIEFASSLGVADIRIISSAQYNQGIQNLEKLPTEVLKRHPILRYRVNNYLRGVDIRGINDAKLKCRLVVDDLAIADDKHFPCIIYMRQQGDPIGIFKNNPNWRDERLVWYENHNCYNDNICKENCLDVCVDYNKKCIGG